MKYHDSVEKSAENLRLALPLMSRHAAPLDPITYAVWYEYVSGINHALRQRMEELTRDGHLLDDADIDELFRRYVAELDEETATRLTQDVHKIMADISQSAAKAGDDAGQFGSELAKWAEEAAKPGDAKSTESLLKHTKGMQKSITSLQSQLDESQQEIEKLRQEVNRAREQSLLDGLTELTNRRGFDSALAACLDECAQSGEAPSLIMIDIDHFKRINDTYGHLFGDKVIRAVARILKDGVKGRDTAARYGGEEFAILLPGTPAEGARAVAEQIRLTVARCRIKRHDNQEPIGNITVSLGVARHRPGEAAAAFIARADAALYASKNGGRNLVTVAEATAA